MIRVVFRYLCKTTPGEAPQFVRLECSVPAPPTPGLIVSPDRAQWFVVQEVRWNNEHRDTYEAFVSRRGDAQPLQPSLAHADMLLCGWENDPT